MSSSNKELRKKFQELRDEGKLYCAICGQKIEKYQIITIDHWIPKSKGGSNDESNLKPAHDICNQIKGNTMPDEFQKNIKERYIYALNFYHINQKNKKLVLHILNNLQHQK